MIFVGGFLKNRSFVAVQRIRWRLIRRYYSNSIFRPLEGSCDTLRRNKYCGCLRSVRRCVHLNRRRFSLYFTHAFVIEKRWMNPRIVCTAQQTIHHDTMLDAGEQTINVWWKNKTTIEKWVQRLHRQITDIGRNFRFKQPTASHIFKGFRFIHYFKVLLKSYVGY